MRWPQSWLACHVVRTRVNGLLCSSTRHKESDMVTLFASTALRRIELQEVMGHIATLEQATRAVHEGYLGHPLYYQAAHTAQRLLALVEAMAWDEGTRIAHEIACLFQTATTFGLVQALHLSELIAAFYWGIAQVSAEQTPYMERDVWG